MKEKLSRKWSTLRRCMDSTLINIMNGQLPIKKTAGDSHFISVMVVIIIVLVIAVLFREKMMSIFTDFFSKTTTQINNLFPA